MTKEKEKEFLGGLTAESTKESGRTVDSTESASSKMAKVMLERVSGALEKKQSGSTDSNQF